MSKARVVYKKDKSVAIIYPNPKSRWENETEDEWLERIFSKDMRNIEDMVDYDDIDSSQLPPRDDRDCWEGEKGKGIKIDLKKKEELEKGKKIKKEMDALLRRQAIDNLTARKEI